MAKREAQARSFSPGKEGPTTLGSAAEEHAQALRQQLLESTELAAQTLIGQTRAEGERRIEMAGRQAQAIAETVSAIEQAEQALTERAKTFADASKALRAELAAFAGTLSESEERLVPEPAGEPELRLVESPPTESPRRQDPPTGIGQILLGSEAEEPEGEDDGQGPQDNRPSEEFEDDEEEDEPEAQAAGDEEDEDPPTPAEIARFFRDHEGPEARSERPALSSRRNRLYTDIGGAMIGLGGAAALLNFVLLK